MSDNLIGRYDDPQPWLNRYNQRSATPGKDDDSLFMPRSSDGNLISPTQAGELIGRYTPTAPAQPETTRADIYRALILDEEVTLDYRGHTLTFAGAYDDSRGLTLDNEHDFIVVEDLAWHRLTAIRDLDYLIDILDEVPR